VKHGLVVSLAAACALGACAHNPFGRGPDAGTRATVGVLAGGAVGAVAGTAVGVGPVTGAAAGMAVGGAIGALVKGPIIKHRQYYLDTRGYCYYVDAKGNPKRAPTMKC
jgi:membrane associated rhomboid family serine protease